MSTTTVARLQSLITRVHRNEQAWEAGFRANVPTYDPADPEQPAEDQHMGQFNELDTERAFDSRTLLLDLTAELAVLVCEMEGDW
ncbi:hypothetical protein ACIQF6_19580 [Kitasatospora sp. NPDC092948]|uniref:hypothetical protein n=1 Tax=Kitasatospora sp. NPDC092948 TaxID=3364088 RepID=UPI00381F3D72